MSSVTFSLNNASSSSSSSSPIVSASFRSKALDKLEEKDLYEFYKANNEILDVYNEKTDIEYINEVKNSIGFIHFIWMGNPIKEKHLNTIETWKDKYPNKQIIIWVDQNALKHDSIIKFAKNNNVILIDLDKVFDENNSFELKQYIEDEKNKLPPNWGAASDIYRYLIMYYFAGTYSDTDSPIRSEPPNGNKSEDLNMFHNQNSSNAYTHTKPSEEGWDEALDFTKDFAFRAHNFGINNDRIMTKNIRQPFWHNFLIEIKNRYQINFNFEPSKNRLYMTFNRTGPTILDEQLGSFWYSFESNEKRNIQLINYSMFSGDFSWRGKLSEDKCKELAKQENIIDRIVNNIILNAKDKGTLNLCKYDKIINFINTLNIDIVNMVINKIKNMDENNRNRLKIKAIFSNSYENYKLMKDFLTKHYLLEENLKITLEKAIKKNYFQLFDALYKKIDKSELIRLLYFIFNQDKLIKGDYENKIKFVDKIIDIIPYQDLNEIKTFILYEAVKNKDENILIKVINKLSNQDLVKVLSNTEGIKVLEITIEKQCGQVIIEILKKLSDEDLCKVLYLEDQNSNFQTGSNSQTGSKDSLLKILKTTINLNGDTILHSAIVLNHKKLVKEIINRLRNRLSNQELVEVLSCRNKDNKTPLDLAKEKGFEKEISKILYKLSNEDNV